MLIGLGSLYTSILPHLLVSGIAEALREAKPPRVYIWNVATQIGETEGYTVAEHPAALRRHTFATVMAYAIYDDHPTALGPKFTGEPVVHDGTEIDGVGLIGENLADPGHPVRHDSNKLARLAMDVYHGRDSGWSPPRRVYRQATESVCLHAHLSLAAGLYDMD